MSADRGDLLTVVVGVGYVGRRVLAGLPKRSTIGLSRSGCGKSGHIRYLDLDADTLPAQSFASDYAIVYTVPPARDKQDDARLVRLLSALAIPPRRIVYLSTTGVYGNHDGAMVNETTPATPESARAKRRVAAERELGRYCEENRCELVILRVPGIYGPERLGIDRIRDGETVLAEEHANPGNRIHIDDLVLCCVAALDVDVPSGAYNVGDGDERSACWFANEVARQLNLPLPPTVDRATAERTFSPMRLSFLHESRRLDLKKMLQVLRVTPKYTDAADGIAASLKEETD